MNETVSNFVKENFFNIITVIVTVIPLIVGKPLITYLKKRTLRKKRYPHSLRPDIKYFTDRKEITEEIFNEMKSVKAGEIFTIYGSAGIGKTEFMKLMNLFFNSVYINKDERGKELYARYTTHKISTKSESYMYDCKKLDIYQIINLIYDSFGLEYKNYKNFDRISSDLCQKNKKKNQIVFIFENIETNDLASSIYEFFSSIITHSKKTKFFFFAVYSSAIIPKDLSTSKIKKLTNFSLDHTSEFFSNHNLIFSENEIVKIHQITNGNLELLKTVVQFIQSRGHNELKLILKSKDMASYYFEHLNENSNDLEFFKAYLALSISNKDVGSTDIQFFLDKDFDIPVTVTRLLNAGFIFQSVNSYTKFSISKTFLPILYEFSYSDIISKQKRINELIEKKVIFLGDFKIIHQLFDNRYSNNIVDILNTKQSEKNYTIALKIYDLMTSSVSLTEYLVNFNEQFNEILYCVLEALVGSGSYSQAEDIIENQLYGKYFNIRNKNITKKNLKLHFFQANLYHLQNRYEDALNIYESLLNSDLVKEKNYPKAKASWGIAHVYRHIGKFEEANNYYEETIEICKKKEKKTIDIYIKCMNERNSIYMYLDRPIPYEYDSYFDKIIFKCEKIRNNKVAELSTNKYKAIYHTKNQNYIEALKLINKTIDEYELKKERLRFNLYYEKAEILRQMGDYDEALYYYKKSLHSSMHNGDKNIQLYSLLGIICLELKTNRLLIHENQEKQIETLERCYLLCKNGEEICFQLGQEHVYKLKKIVDLQNENDLFLNTMLPLF